MAKGKRVSNKSGGNPGKRSSKTRDRHFQNVARRRAFAAANAAPVEVPRGISKSNPRRVPKPPIMSRAVSRVKRFFSRGPK